MSFRQSKFRLLVNINLGGKSGLLVSARISCLKICTRADTYDERASGPRLSKMKNVDSENTDSFLKAWYNQQKSTFVKNNKGKELSKTELAYSKTLLTTLLGYCAEN